jgi:hypothetical protein
LSTDKKTWVQKKEEKKGDNKLPVQVFKPTLWTYVERTGAIKQVECTRLDESEPVKTVDTELHVVRMPPFFPVLDVLLVRRDAKDITLHFFFVQVTRSQDPFEKHFTDTSCRDTSQKRIAGLVKAAVQAISKDAQHKTSFVMLAPNAEPSKIAAPGQKEDYYFSPAGLLPVPLPVRSARSATKKAMLAALRMQLGILTGSINDLIGAASAPNVEDVEQYVPWCFSVADLQTYCTSNKLNLTGPIKKPILWACIVADSAKEK